MLTMINHRNQMMMMPFCTNFFSGVFQRWRGCCQIFNGRWSNQFEREQDREQQVRSSVLLRLLHLLLFCTFCFVSLVTVGLPESNRYISIFLVFFLHFTFPASTSINPSLHCLFFLAWPRGLKLYI